MRGYLILEFELPDEVDTTTFPTVLTEAREALREASQQVTRVHAAIGSEGLRESVDYVLRPDDTAPQA